MRVFGGILIVLITLVVYLRIRLGKRRDRQIAEAAEAAAAKRATGEAARANVK